MAMAMETEVKKSTWDWCWPHFPPSTSPHPSQGYHFEIPNVKIGKKNWTGFRVIKPKLLATRPLVSKWIYLSQDRIFRSEKWKPVKAKVVVISLDSNKSACFCSCHCAFSSSIWFPTLPVDTPAQCSLWIDLDENKNDFHLVTLPPKLAHPPTPSSSNLTITASAI